MIECFSNRLPEHAEPRDTLSVRAAEGSNAVSVTFGPGWTRAGRNPDDCLAHPGGTPGKLGGDGGRGRWHEREGAILLGNNVSNVCGPSLK